MTIPVQPHIRDLSPYQPGLPIELVARTYGIDPSHVIKLASNENPLGMSPLATVAMKQSLDGGNRYPEQYSLVQALATYHHLDTSNIVIGNGSIDVLDMIARTYLGHKTAAISSQYAFAINAIVTQATGAENIIVPAQAYGHDLSSMYESITAATRVIWISNPNNPTGTFVSYDACKAFLDKVPRDIIVVLDEAYYEYLTDEDREESSAWLARYSNLVLVRTFSKIYGLAGLRIGYGLASPEIIELLNRVRHPFNGNVLALSAAIAALGDTAFVADSFTANQTGRKQLIAGLQRLNLKTLPSYGNFLTFKVSHADQVLSELLKAGTIVRPLAGYGMPDWLRVTIGLEKENAAFLQQLEQAI